ncbi:MAG TPA: hypothetical protein VE987_21240 [Polyangiaceae bacterium]|nr:hypothetical protein [Polyangiaceae bacterium]
MDGSPWQLYVFRETYRFVGAARLVEPLLDDVRAGRIADALVRAGEIESALADAGDPERDQAARLTDTLAAALVEGRRDDGRATMGASILARSLAASGPLRVVPPESFSYYALHPADFVERMASPPLDGVRRAAVVGLRSIGTTLSAVVSAALRARGGAAERRTVRPRGEPYARSLHLDGPEAEWVRRHLEDGSDFLVVDEGPGLSGSTLLAVVDALVGAGVPLDRLTIVCTRQPDPSKLLARNGPERWRALRTAVVRCAPRLPAGFAPMAPGGWRARFLGAHARWPACWPWLERAKALSDDGRTLLKFEGLGRHGADALARAALAAEAGFGASVRRASDGRAAYGVLPGTAACACRLDEAIVDRLADYCAWRAGGAPADASPSRLEDMARENAAVALGVDVRLALEIERPVVADARMMPHEWIELPSRVLVKTDAASHGDDHLLPGPTDVAWDLAGAIVEWRMPRAAIARLVAGYARRSGDRVERRLPAWLLAYALYALAWTELAAAGVELADEHERLAREAEGRRRWLRAAAALGLLGKGAAALAAAGRPA